MGGVCSLYDHPDREKEAGESHRDAIASPGPVFLGSKKTATGSGLKLKVLLIGFTIDTQEQSGTKVGAGRALRAYLVIFAIFSCINRRQY